MAFNIQKTDISERVRPGRTRKYPFHEMLPGTMFFVPGPTPRPNTVMSLTSTTARRLGMTFMTRQMYMRQVDGEWIQCDARDDGAKRGVAVIRTA